jgi:hypothetical protein
VDLNAEHENFDTGARQVRHHCFVIQSCAWASQCHAFSGGNPGTELDNYEKAVYKYTYSERKNRDFELFLKHLSEVNYDRKIWMARDPRDIAVSQMLFRWHKGHRGRRKQYREHLRLVQRKEQNPLSIPFHVLYEYTGHAKWPMSTKEVVEKERSKYRATLNFVNDLGNTWFIYKYEDMIEKNFDHLNRYLGFEIKANAEIPATTKKIKAARQKTYGEWRNWFTQEDIELFKPAYLPYLELIGYDCNDWTPNPNPVIDPEVSSLYIQNLMRNNSPKLKRIFKDLVSRPFENKRKP